MPSIKDAVAKANQMKAAGVVSAPPPPSIVVPSQGSSPLDLPMGGGLPQRGMLPATMVLASDRSDSSRAFRGAGMRSSAFPFPVPTGAASASAVVAAASAPAAAVAATFEYLVNNVPSPTQGVLNMLSGPGIAISMDALGNVIWSNISASEGDGLIHGETPWETDPAYSMYRTDFLTNGTAQGLETNQIYMFDGGVAWLLTTPVTPVNISNGFPYQGIVSIPNDSTPSDFTAFSLANMGASGSTDPVNAWPVFDYPSWKMVWNFSLQGGGASTTGAAQPAFSAAQTSFYMGLAANPGANGSLSTGDSSARPCIFCGLRFDTDTTAPSIGDTTFNFECRVDDTLAQSRVNTQGNVVDTGIAPVAYGSYRFEIACSAVGVVTMSLSNGTTTFTSPVTMPPWTITGVYCLNDGNGRGVVQPFASIQPFANGSISTLAGCLVNTAFNGTFPAIATTQTLINIILAGSATIVTELVATWTGYPAVYPVVTFGNDSTLSPTANAKCLLLDYSAFIWNPGVNGGTGTPNSNLPRYF